MGENGKAIGVIRRFLDGSIDRNTKHGSAHRRRQWRDRGGAGARRPRRNGPTCGDIRYSRVDSTHFRGVVQGGIGDTPIGHCAIWIGSVLEAAHRFLKVEAITPKQTPVEPALGVGGVGSDGAGVGAKVKGIGDHEFASFLDHCAIVWVSNKIFTSPPAKTHRSTVHQNHRLPISCRHVSLLSGA